MSEEIQNAGLKGKALAIFVVAFILFISLWRYVYRVNAVMEFPY